MQLYYITDRKQFADSEAERIERLLGKISEAANCGIDYIQLREKDLSGRERESLAGEALARIQFARSNTKLLINSRVDIALAVGAHGVHLRSEDISVENVREIYQKCGADTPVRERPEPPIIGVSCHKVEDVAQAAAANATYAVFGPVFEKSGLPVSGLDNLREACLQQIPVFAIGGVTLQNAQSCIEAGATGIAGIRLFQENEIVKIAAKFKN